MGAAIQTITVVGAGVIGSGWTVQMLAHGLDVIVTDPSAGADERLHQYVERARPTVERLGHSIDGWQERLRFSSDMNEAVAQAQFVQECGPERQDVKSALIARIDKAARPEVAVASSSSGLMPSQLAAMAPRHPERIVVGHPFNPVYLIPLVEVVGTPATSPAIVDTCMEFYAAIGKRPVHLRAEQPGHLANRLQAALWREAYSLVERGVATVSEIDTAISQGPGLRWALLGPLVTQHLSGGEGGMAHVLEHLGPPAQAWMDDLGEPQLTPELASALVRGIEDELAGIDTLAMNEQRDALLVELLVAKARAADLP